MKRHRLTFGKQPRPIYFKIEPKVTRLLADGRSRVRMQTLADVAEVERLEEEYKHELDRSTLGQSYQGPKLAMTNRLDLIATSILTRDRRQRAADVRARGEVFGFENDWLSPWQYGERLHHELWFSSLDWLSRNGVTQRIVDKLHYGEGGWKCDRVLRIPQGSFPTEYDGVERGYGEMVGVMWSPPVGTP